MTRLSETLVGTQLNSVWLEGILVADPVDLAGHAPSCRFRVRVPQPRLPGPPPVFLIEAGEAALGGCRNRLGRGQTVRIIGRLHQHRWKDPTGMSREQVKVVGALVEPTATR